MGGSNEIKFELSQKAYIKLVLHALKHPSSAVNGILVGRLSSDTTTIQIADVIPVSHSACSLLPPLQIAVTQGEEYFLKEGELNVVGYYHANERYDDCELGPAARRNGDHIFRNFPQAAVLLLDNKKLDHLIKEKARDPAVMLFTRDSSKGWHQVGSEGTNKLVLKEPSAHALLSDYIASKKWLEIVDFEDHLDDISKDWVNPNLFK
ncbi:ER membrane protein complex subunit 8/9 homolog [Carex rostrata]